MRVAVTTIRPYRAFDKDLARRTGVFAVVHTRREIAVWRADPRGRMSLSDRAMFGNRAMFGSHSGSPEAAIQTQPSQPRRVSDDGASSSHHAPVPAELRTDSAGAAAAPHSAACAPPTLDEEIAEVLADGPAPLDLGPLTPAELDAAVEAALASPAVSDVAVAPCQPGAADAITEIHPAIPRGRGESMKRRKRSRKPGDQRHK